MFYLMFLVNMAIYRISGQYMSSNSTLQASTINYDSIRRTGIDASEPRGIFFPVNRPEFGGGNQGRGADRMSECDALVRDREGWIFTPNYPSDYENYRTCYYVIERHTVDTCKVQMTLNDFDLEESPNCLADYLDLRDGQQGVLCGTLAAGTKKILQYRSGQSTITIRFKSDGKSTRKGFMIQLKQIPNSCGVTGVSRTNFCNKYIDSFTSSITSPGFPNGYGSNLRCAYTVRKADPRICKVLLEFRKIDFGRSSHSPCHGDYLELPDLSRVCEAYPSRKILEFPRGSDLLSFHFITDGYASGKGFDIEVLQVPDSCGGAPLPKPTVGQQCDQEISTITGHFRSPNHPHSYGPSERCRYSIRKVDSAVCSIELDFRSFDVEYGGPGCTKDYLSLPDLSRLCGRVSGKQLIDMPENIDSINLYFLSDQYGQRPGFDIHVTQLFNTCSRPGPKGSCDQEVSSYRGSFTSPNFPSSYPTNQRCTYTVRKVDPTVCSVELDFRKFELEFSRNRCSKDFLLMPDRTRICGATSGIQIVKFLTGSNTLTMNFFTDSYGTGRGFDIGVLQRRNTCTTPPTNCNIEISTTAGRISSPGYPRYYTPGLRCQYRIRRPEPSTCTVELDFRSLDVAVSAGCSEDYLEFPDRSRLCGTQASSKVLDYSSIGSDVMTLNFVSDSIGAGRGFDIIVRQLPNSCSIVPPPPASCDMTVDEDSGVIHSPNYPEDYPPNSLCVFTVKKIDPSVCQVRLEFLDFDIEESEDCISDFLQTDKSGNKLCGVRTPDDKVLHYEPGSENLRMVFKSDSLTERRGFEARIRQVKNSCYRPIGPGAKVCGTFSEQTSFLQSENFPLLYQPNTDCEFKIIRANQNICQLELYFSHFDVSSDSSAICDRDYLEIKGDRYCGKRDGQTVLVDFPRAQNEISLHFKTDSYDQLSGFRIEIKQLTSGCSPVPPKSCDQTFTGQTIQIISPGYQTGSYPDDADCRYTVKKSSFKVCALQVKFYTFDVEQSNDCEKDYLEISDQKLCGRMEYDSIRTYQFLEDETVITFHSDSYTNGAGFFVLVEQKDC